MDRKVIGYFGRKIPVFTGIGVVKDKAEATCNELNNAYKFLINERGQESYARILTKLKEIHLERNVNNKRAKYDLLYDDEKPILKILYNADYKDLIFCITSVTSELIRE